MKSHDSRQQAKKKPLKNAKEKRLAKHAKKTDTSLLGSHGAMP
ncbi:hypothetical protein [Pseudomonas sp.]|nr:hypothetical protein [Pseudomonas sp.]